MPLLLPWEGIYAARCSTENESGGWMGYRSASGICDGLWVRLVTWHAFRLTCELPKHPLRGVFLTRKEDIVMIKCLIPPQQEPLVSRFPWLSETPDMGAGPSGKQQQGSTSPSKQKCLHHSNFFTNKQHEKLHRGGKSDLLLSIHYLKETSRLFCWCCEG